MIVLVLAWVGGLLTIISPCILPVLPFVFAQAGQPFRRNGLPMLVGMGATFAAAASLAAVGGAWAVQAHRYGRLAALLVLALFGLALLWPRLAQWLARPFVALGGRLERRAGTGASPVWRALGLGAATGLLWVPCAGPILGLLLTAAALHGPGVGTTLLLLVFATGAATSLALALLAGGRVLVLLRRSLGIGEWLRRALGVLVLAGVAAIALGLDTGLLTRLSLASTTGLEQRVLDRLWTPPARRTTREPVPGSPLPVEGAMPSLDGATGWLNGPPRAAGDLRGQVVLVDFWTYSCINCLRTLPHVRAWAGRYRAHGLVVIGVHTPEFAFEKDPGNVARAMRELGIDYPVALDNDYAIWRGFDNRYWPAHYFIDHQGRIRHHHFGEGDYDRSEAVIRQLLVEAGQAALPSPAAAPILRGVQAPGTGSPRQSPETYLGYARAAGFGGGRLAFDTARDYRAPGRLMAHQWALDGRWTVRAEDATAETAGARIRYRFRGRDLHLVLGPGRGGPVRFRIRIDGRLPGADHGMDTDAQGAGVVDEHRLYQLVRLRGGVDERLFEIEFLDPGVRAYAFTFG